MKKHLGALVLALGSAWVAQSAEAGSISGTIGILAQPTVQNYSFTFSTPIAPLTGLVAWSAAVSGELVDGGRDGVSLTPFLGPSIYQFLIDGVVVGTDSLGVVTADYAASYSGFYNCGGGCSSLQLKFLFTTSGGEDSYNNITALFEVIEAEAPEPGLALLFGLGLAGMAAARRKA